MGFYQLSFHFLSEYVIYQSISNKNIKLFFQAFLEEVKGGQPMDRNIIGQFGVGFYSAFMVGEKVDVFSRSIKTENEAYKWTSDG